MDRLLLWDIEVARLAIVLREIQAKRPGIHQYLSIKPNTGARLTREVWERFIGRVRRGEF